MGHSQGQALLETTILALVTILLLNLAWTLTALVFQFHPHSSPEKALIKKDTTKPVRKCIWNGQKLLLSSFVMLLRCSTVTHQLHYLATLTGMHAIVETRGLVPADLTLHADPRACAVFSPETQLLWQRGRWGMGKVCIQKGMNSKAKEYLSDRYMPIHIDNKSWTVSPV